MDYPDLLKVARYNASAVDSEITDVEPLFMRSNEKVLAVLTCECHNESCALISHIEDFAVHYANGATEYMKCRIYGVSHGYTDSVRFLYHPSDGWNVWIRKNDTTPTLWQECDDFAHAARLFQDATGFDAEKFYRSA